MRNPELMNELEDGMITLEELVPISTAELAALRRDRERLRTADELWRMETGESLIETVDQISEVMMDGLRTKRGRATSPAPEPTRFSTVASSVTTEPPPENGA